MSEVLRRAAPADLPTIVRLANAVFRSKTPGDMGREFPTLFSAGNAGNLYVAFEDARLVAHVGVQPFAVRMDGVEVPVACIGAVCTDPEFRGQGLAWRLFDMAIADARARGDVLMPISGGRSLYRKHAAVPVGPRHDFTVQRARLGAPAGRRYAPADAGECIRLIHALPAHYRQERALFETLLDAQIQAGGCAFVRESARQGRLDALAILRPETGDQSRLWLANAAGAERAVAGLCAAALDAARIDRLALKLMWHERELLEHFAPLGENATVNLTGGHTVKVLNLEKLVRLFEKRLGPLGPAVSGEALELQLPGRGLVAVSDPECVGYLLFAGGEHWRPDLALDRELGRAVRPALPLPMPEYGINYI